MSDTAEIPSEARGQVTEWACRWLPEADGHTPLTPARDEAWARKHARQWGTTPMRRSCSPWVEA